jgi:hypothetical protein
MAADKADENARGTRAYRDANAATLADFLNVARMSFPEPPDLAAPANPLPGLLTGYQGQPVAVAGLHRPSRFLTITPACAGA